MSESTRVYNDRKYDIGVRLQDGIERVIKRGSFLVMSKDDIDYLASIAPALLYGEKQLRLDDRALSQKLGFIESDQQPVFDEAEILKNLMAKPQALQQWLSTIAEPYLLDLVYDVAREMDLPASKIKLLQERLPDRDIIGSDT